MSVSKKTLQYRKINNLCPKDGKPNEPGKNMCNLVWQKLL